MAYMIFIIPGMVHTDIIPGMIQIYRPASFAATEDEDRGMRTFSKMTAVEGFFLHNGR